MASRFSPDVFADFYVGSDSEDTTFNAAISISELLNRVITSNKVCSIVVSGGSAIQLTLQHLAKLDVPWKSVRLYMADERCVPCDSKARNDAMVYNALVQPVGIRSEHFFRIPAEFGPHQSAQSYARLLSVITGFDIALLGVGSDGHIASLFPNHPSIDNEERVIAVENSPKFPPNRVSVGLTMLRGATHRIVVLTGGEKSEIISQLHQGKKLPVALVNPTKWFLDSQVSHIGSGSDIAMRRGPKT